MDFAWDIFIGFIEIFALIVGVLGVAFSILLLLTPQRAAQLSRLFNRSVDVDKKITALDKSIDTERLIYQHNIIAGLGIIIGSALTLIFLLYRFEASKFIDVFFGRNMFTTTHEIVISTLAILGKLAGILGLLIGAVLLFSPEQLRKIEKQFNLTFSTQSVVNRLDQTQKDIDAIVLRQPRLYGAIGFIFSIILLILAIDNLSR